MKFKAAIAWLSSYFFQRAAKLHPGEAEMRRPNPLFCCCLTTK